MTTYLEERLEWYDHNYRIGNALITDKQFDQLEKNLLRIDPDCDYFTNKKSLPLPSLKKNSIDEFLEGLLPDTRLLIEPKIDGIAIALQYRDGNLEKSISRKGIDVTNKIAEIQDIPLKLPVSGIMQIRGELFTPNRSPNFSQRIASGFVRAAAGSPEGISFCGFQIINGKLNQYETIQYLKKLGFNTPDIKSCNYTSQVQVFRQQWLDKKLFTEYPTDGIVVKINSRKLQLIREKSKIDYPHWQIAIKD